MSLYKRHNMPRLFEGTKPLPVIPLRQRSGPWALLVLLCLVTTGCKILPAESSLPAQSQVAVEAEAQSAEAESKTGAAAVGGEASDRATILKALSESRVVYLGERHDSELDHQAQLEIIQALVAQGEADGEKVAIAFEMFQRPFQSVLDDYSAGKIDADSLRRDSEYDERWGFDWALYEPIISYGKAQGLPLLAANTPQELTRQVAREGFESLDDEALAQIPPLEEINRDNVEYRSWVASVFVGHHGHGHASKNMDPEAMDAAFERFFSAQVLWDETMAETVAEFAQNNPDHTVVVLAGQGHIMHGWGIPDRVARRLGSDLKHTTVLLNPSETMAQGGEGGIADYFWLSP